MEWVRHSGATTLCCETATQDLLDTEPDAFDCSKCERRIKRDALDDDNLHAWRLWLTVGTRFVKDFGAAPQVLARVMEGMDADDVDELLARLSVIYDTLCPVQPKVE